MDVVEFSVGSPMDLLGRGYPPGTVPVVGRTRDAYGRKVAAWFPATQELIADGTAYASVQQMILHRFRRQLFPWEFPDRPALPTFAVWPWMDSVLRCRLATWVRLRWVMHRLRRAEGDR